MDRYKGIGPRGNPSGKIPKGGIIEGMEMFRWEIPYRPTDKRLAATYGDRCTWHVVGTLLTLETFRDVGTLSV